MRHPHAIQSSSTTWSLVGLVVLCLWIVLVIFSSGSSRPSLSTNPEPQSYPSLSGAEYNDSTNTNISISTYQQKEQSIIAGFGSGGQYSGIVGSVNSGVRTRIRSVVGVLTGVRYTPIIKPDLNNIAQADTNRLEYLYTQTRDPKIAGLLVSKYVVDYRYTDAYRLLSPLTLQQQLDMIGAEKLLFIAANGPLLDSSNANGIKTFNELTTTLHTRKFIGDDTLYRYQGLVRLMVLDTTGYISSLKKITTPTYITQMNQSTNRINRFGQQKDMPQYYLQALLALDLMQGGYFKIAQQISARILVINETYILPYQILAYSHFVLNNWSISSEYALKLLDLDETNKQRYVFMLGVSAYRQGKYQDSVLYLNQVRDSQLINDARRYMLLSYQAVGDSKNTASSIQILLSQASLEQSDFGTIFDILFFRPYAQRAKFTLYTENKQLALLSLEQCYIKLPEKEQTICTYGKAGVFIAQAQLDKAVKYLYFLAEHMPTSAVYEALGQYYSAQGKIEESRNFMIQASLLSSDIGVKERIKADLLKQ